MRCDPMLPPTQRGVATIASVLALFPHRVIAAANHNSATTWCLAANVLADGHPRLLHSLNERAPTRALVALPDRTTCKSEPDGEVRRRNRISVAEVEVNQPVDGPPGAALPARAPESIGLRSRPSGTPCNRRRRPPFPFRGWV